MGGDVTALLERWKEGDQEAERQVWSLLYDEMRHIADQQFKRERRADHTLQPTALVHEAFIKLAEGTSIDASGRSHLLALVAQSIRQLLVDHSRGKHRKKRGGSDLVRVQLAELVLQQMPSDLNLVDLDRAMVRLETIDKLASAIVELKFMGGLTINEIAAYTGRSRATVSRKWEFARAFLRSELEGVQDHE